jgi:nucleotide-binding universal stress UspA family protein
MSFAPQSILVPVAIDPEDDLFLAEYAVMAACDIAEKFSAKITLLHLAPLITPGQPISFDVTGHVLDAFMKLLKARFDFGRLKLAELQKAALARGITIEGRVVDTLENTASVIIASATELSADLLVISSHGRRGLSKVLFGSVAARVAEIAHMPVLLLHPPKAKKQ